MFKNLRITELLAFGPNIILAARIAQSVQRRDTSWAAGPQTPTEARDFFLLHNFHTVIGPTQPHIQ
jgi:hypothetical protein